MNQGSERQWKSFALILVVLLLALATSDCQVNDRESTMLTPSPTSTPIADQAEVLRRVQREVPFPVKEPAYLPPGYTLADAGTTIPTSSPGLTPIIEEAEVRLKYANHRGGMIVITEMALALAAQQHNATPVPINSNDGWLSISEMTPDAQATVTVTWSEGGVSYRVNGSPPEQLNSDELLKVARSMERE